MGGLNNNLFASKYTYYIPKQDFEEVIQTFLTVESEVLESNAIYNAETKTIDVYQA